MKIKILYFGMTAEPAGRSEEYVELPESGNIDTLRRWLTERHPGLSEMEFIVAQNRSISNLDTPLNQDDEIALLPPFAGG